MFVILLSPNLLSCDKLSLQGAGGGQGEVGMSRGEGEGILDVNIMYLALKM